MPEIDEEVAVHIEPSSSDGTSLPIAHDVLSWALFENGATAVTQTPDGSLLAGFRNLPDADAAIAAITAGYPALVRSIDIAQDADHDWATNQRGGFTPTRIGNWLVRTPWTGAPDDVDPRFDIQIDPGEAFGHGAHPSTKLALQLMDRHLVEGASIIDFGTGTGVLAIIAARAGAQVLAIDNSATAIEVARRNVMLNTNGQFAPVADRIDLHLGDIAAIDLDDSQLVVANVTIDIHRLLAPRLRGAHTVIASGVLCNQVSRLRDLYSSHCAKTISSVGEWAAVELAHEAMSKRGAQRV